MILNYNQKPIYTNIDNINLLMKFRREEKKRKKKQHKY